MSIDSEEPREARTHFEIERLLPATSLLRVVLETGRTHQIRVHLAAIGHPVCGDPQYGTPGQLGLDRQFLHAARLAFEHPVTGAAVDVSSPLPDDLLAALSEAERDEGKLGMSDPCAPEKAGSGCASGSTRANRGPGGQPRRSRLPDARRRPPLNATHDREKRAGRPVHSRPA